MDQEQPLKFSQQFLRRVRLLIVLALVIAVIGISYRSIEYIYLRRHTEELAILNVAIIKAAEVQPTETIVLPGNIVAWHETTIYARTNGYVKEWLADIGTRVTAGQLLAKIATPEVNAELRQTEADLKTAQANNQLAQSTARRWVHLLKTDSVSKQETDEKVSDAEAKAAIVKSTRANRDRLLDLVSFERVVAPFDGIIMSRTTDIGRLINAGSGTVPLFQIVQADRLRVYVRVPEYFSSNIKPNLIAELHLTEHPGKIYYAKLLDTAKAIDRTTRTLLVQFELDNSNNELLPGSYAQLYLNIPSKKKSVLLPVNTLIFQAAGLQVATIDGNSEVLLKRITIGRDFGVSVEVVAGLKPGETVILNPPDSLMSKQKVRIVSTELFKDIKAS